MRTGFYVALVGTAVVLGACGDNRERCGAGTIAVDGECVPDGTVTCGQGTVLDAATGECVIDPDACPEGTVFVDGACIPEDDALTADLEEAAEPNDAAEAGDVIAGELDVPAAGADGVVLHGCVTPYRDVDQNGNLDIDFDAWILHADGPTVVEITADGVHGLSAGYAVLPTDQEPLAIGAWRRFGINLAGDTSSRQLYLPMAGDYVLYMSDSRSLFLQDGAAGDDETCYFTTVKSVEAPAAQPLTAAAPATATHDGAPLFYAYDPTECDIVRFDHAVSGAAILGSYVTMLNGEVNRVSSTVTPLGGLHADDEVVLVVDPEYDYSLQPPAVQTSVFRYITAVLPTDGSSLTVDNPSDTFSFESTTWACVDVPANTVSHVQLGFSDPAHFGFLTKDFGVISVPADIPAPPVTDFSDFVLFPTADRYYVALIEIGDGGGTFDVTATVDHVVPTGVGVPGTVDDAAFSDYGATWHKFSGGTATWVALSASAVGFGGDVGIDLFDRQTSIGVPELDFGPVQDLDLADDGSELGGRVVADDPASYLIRVTDRAGAADATASYDLAITNRDYDDLGTITEITPVHQAGVAATAGEPVLYFVRGTPGDLMTIAVTPTGMDPAIVVLDRTEKGTSVADDGGTNQPETLSFSVTTAWTAFAVYPFSGGTFDLDVSVTSPVPYTSTAGTIAYADVCSDVNAVQLLVGDPDESFSAQQQLSFPFALFGESVDTYVVSTNGFLAFGDPGPAFSFANGTLPSAQPPNGVIAPFWDDFVVTQLCVLDNGTDTATIEWEGQHYDSGLSMQTQAILHADGEVDFVYGPDQAANGAGTVPEAGPPGATVGLETVGGTFGHMYVNNQPTVAPNSSRVLTPTP